ncbi:MAG TPA: SDR family NAD(P)-dependent oxidoreductase [Candidatus Lokiarchaeia archaeon]|nr:SDR family NAD(P)-dependent oxidoreductase [Candidatus Lokiarchaeia archaeon]
MTGQINVVTGGAGFIGSHLVHKLVENGIKVIVIDNLSSGKLDTIKDLIDEGKVDFFQVDIRDKEALNNGIFTGNESIVYHLAADPRVKESVDDPIDCFEQNVTGTLNLLETIRNNKIPCMVFASSGGTLYGDVDTFPTPESIPLRPISPYGASKAAAEMYMSAYAGSYELKIAALRFANIYGPGSTHGVMYDFYHKLQDDPVRLEILGDGQQSKSYLFVSDCVDACTMIGEWLLETQKPGTYECFNLGTKTWETVDDLATTMIEVLGLGNVEFVHTGGERGWTGDVAKMLLDTSKIENLGWTARVSFKDGVKTYLDSLGA